MTASLRAASTIRPWLWLGVTLPGLLGGCMPYMGTTEEAIQQVEARHAPSYLTSRTYQTVDRMLNGISIPLTNSSTAIVGSIADIGDVNRSTPFGNVIAELVRTRLVQRGLPVADMRLRSAVMLDPEGELTLSRERHSVYPPPVAAEVVTGTYATANSRVYVSLKMIEEDNAHIVAAGDFSVPRTADVDQLLLGGMLPAR